MSPLPESKCIGLAKETSLEEERCANAPLAVMACRDISACTAAATASSNVAALPAVSVRCSSFEPGKVLLLSLLLLLLPLVLAPSAAPGAEDARGALAAGLERHLYATITIMSRNSSPPPPPSPMASPVVCCGVSGAEAAMPAAGGVKKLGWPMLTTMAPPVQEMGGVSEPVRAVKAVTKGCRGVLVVPPSWKPAPGQPMAVPRLSAIILAAVTAVR